MVEVSLPRAMVTLFPFAWVIPSWKRRGCLRSGLESLKAALLAVCRVDYETVAYLGVG